MVKHVFGGLLVAGLCIAPVFAEEEARIESSYSDDSARIESRADVDVDRSESIASSDESLRSERVESDTRAMGAPVREERTERADDGEKADRSGPVPFGDLGNVGDGDLDKSVLSEKAIEQDKELLVKGEVRGEDLILHLPEGAKHDTLSLRSSSGIDIKNAELMRIGRIEGNDLIIKLSDVRRGDGDLGNLWLWGTGAESASLLQRVQFDGDTRVAGVSSEVQSESEIASSDDASLRTERSEVSSAPALGSSVRADASDVEVERDVEHKDDIEDRDDDDKDEDED